MQCPKCGVENDDRLKFCRACGGALAANLPAAAPPEAPTERLPVVAPAAPPPPPAPPPPLPPPATPPAVAPPTPIVAAPAGAPRSNAPIMIGLIVAFALLVLIGVVAAVGVTAWRTLNTRTSTTVAAATKALPTTPNARPSDDGSGTKTDSSVGEKSADDKPGVRPEPATDPVAEATVVLEKHLAADLGSDGNEMKKYLGGQALARFNPEVVGQEDIAVHSKQISDHNVRDDNNIEFTVSVAWSPADSKDIQTDTQTYVVTRTDRGWLITSTPEM